MTVWTLIQVFIDLAFMGGIAAAWWRLRRPPQDDPRLSRGLQLLQTKITILEDLSDRTDAQVKQLTALLDQKTRMLQNKVLEAEQQVMKIDHSMNKSLEVAEIFQDKIPHNEILERQRTVEYVKAARMAHSGLSVDEIANTVHLPREQVELIAKFNREQLMFDETQLPAWAQKETSHEDPTFSMTQMDFVSPLENKNMDLNDSQNIAQQFKAAVNEAKAKAENPPPAFRDTMVGTTLRSGFEHMQPAVQTVKSTAQNLKSQLINTAEDLLRNATISSPTTGPQKDSSVKKVIFPRIDKAP